MSGLISSPDIFLPIRTPDRLSMRPDARAFLEGEITGVFIGAFTVARRVFDLARGDHFHRAPLRQQRHAIAHIAAWTTALSGTLAGFKGATAQNGTSS